MWEVAPASMYEPSSRGVRYKVCIKASMCVREASEASSDASWVVKASWLDFRPRTPRCCEGPVVGGG